jgi:dihydroneopterin aldolase
MSTYNEVLSQVQSLTSDEQLRLLEELAALVRRQVTSEYQCRFRELQGVSKDKWRGFLPKRVDALEFQRSLRQEWGE